MRLILSLLAIASLAAPSSAQSFTYRDLTIRGHAAVMVVDGAPRLVVCGDSAMSAPFVQWTGPSSPLVDLSIHQFWAYDPNACRVDHPYAIYSSTGWIQRAFTLAAPGQWHPLPSTSLPGSISLGQSGGHVAWEIGCCRQWSGWGVQGYQPCSTEDTGCWGGTGYPDMWAVVLNVSER